MLKCSNQRLMLNVESVSLASGQITYPDISKSSIQTRTPLNACPSNLNCGKTSAFKPSPSRIIRLQFMSTMMLLQATGQIINFSMIQNKFTSYCWSSLIIVTLFQFDPKCIFHFSFQKRNTPFFDTESIEIPSSSDMSPERYHTIIFNYLNNKRLKV